MKQISYNGSGCHNAVKITQRWSTSRPGLQRWVGLQPAQLCDGLPAQTQSSEPVTAAWQLVTACDSWPGWQTPAASQGVRVCVEWDLGRLRDHGVCIWWWGWPVPDQGSVSHQDFWCEIKATSLYGVQFGFSCKYLPSLKINLLKERFCEIKIPLLLEYWSGKVLKRATSGRLQTQTARLGDGGSKWHTPVTVEYLENMHLSWRIRWDGVCKVIAART